MGHRAAKTAAGRRVTKNGRRFVYDGYLQIAILPSTTTASNYSYYIWDPSESVATRPLVWYRNDSVAYYVFDGNKNVSEVVVADGSLAAHYEYAPFGAVAFFCGTSAATNPWRFSSEYAEDDTATVYYNYRHYEPMMGRWLQRDPIGNRAGRNLSVFVHNCVVNAVDYIDVGKSCGQKGQSLLT